MAIMFVNGSGGNQPSLQRTFYRCFLPSFGSFSHEVSEEKILRNRPTNNKNCLWQPCLRTYRDEMSCLYRGASIHNSYQVSVHLVTRFRRRSFLQIDQLITSIAHGNHVNRSGRNELSLQWNFHTYFLPSFGSFGQAVSEEKIQM